MSFMRTAALLGLAASIALAVPAAAQLQPGEKEATITAIDGVIAAKTKWERAWSGPMTADGMTSTADGALLFAQEQSNAIWKLWPNGQSFVQWPYIVGAGSVSIDGAGRVFAIERTCTDPGYGPPANCKDATRVIQLAPERKVLASAFADGKTLGRLNDVAADGLGGVYYTQGGIYHVSAAGAVSVIDEGNGLFTNGLVLSPDSNTLYVTNRTKVIAFDVAADGSASNRRDFATLSRDGDGFGGDGMAVDDAGRLYVTGDAGVYVFDKAGKELGVIPTPRRSITVAFAGADRKTLYIGAMGAMTPDGKLWETPKGVRNVAMTVYKVKTLSAGLKSRPK